MFCTNCGNEIPNQSRFCTKCGAPVASTTNLGIPIPMSTLGTETKKTKFEARKIFVILLYILLGLLVIGSTLVWMTAQGDSGMLVKTIINWLLGIIFGVSVLSMIGGGIVAIVLVIKASEKTIDQNYYRRNALWSILGPMILIVAVILAYVIINVISNLVSTPVVTQ